MNPLLSGVLGGEDATLQPRLLGLVSFLSVPPPSCRASPAALPPRARPRLPLCPHFTPCFSLTPRLLSPVSCCFLNGPVLPVITQPCPRPCRCRVLSPGSRGIDAAWCSSSHCLGGDQGSCSLPPARRRFRGLGARASPASSRGASGLAQGGPRPELHKQTRGERPSEGASGARGPLRSRTRGPRPKPGRWTARGGLSRATVPRGKPLAVRVAPARPSGGSPKAPLGRGCDANTRLRRTAASSVCSHTRHVQQRIFIRYFLPGPRSRPFFHRT